MYLMLTVPQYLLSLNNGIYISGYTHKYGSVYGVILHEKLEELSSFVLKTDLKFQDEKYPILKSLMMDNSSKYFNIYATLRKCDLNNSAITMKSQLQG